MAQDWLGKPSRAGRACVAWASGRALGPANQRNRRGSTGIAGFVLAAIVATPAGAGPPYVTDDPIPTDLGKWEIYAFGAGTHVSHATEGEAGFDINYGAAKDLQITTVIPFAYEAARGDRLIGLGDIEFGAKYLFVHQKEGTATPDVSFYPEISTPTGGHRRGSGKVGVFLPLWAQKDLGKWTMFGGGGYAINPGPDARNSWLVGYALSRQVTDKLNLGIELYHQTPEERGGKATTGASVGAIYDLSEKWALLGSIGPGLSHRAENGRYSFYFSLAFHN